MVRGCTVLESSKKDNCICTTVLYSLQLTPGLSGKEIRRGVCDEGGPLHSAWVSIECKWPRHRGSLVKHLLSSHLDLIRMEPLPVGLH